MPGTPSRGREPDARSSAALVALAIALSMGCTVSATIGETDGGGRRAPDGDIEPQCTPVACGTRTYACGDCIDQDDDGRADAADPECIGPCDDSEEILGVAIPGGDGAGCSLDCYFDPNQGSGDDGCEWDHRCDPLGPDPRASCAPRDPPPADARCPETQSETCNARCGALTPNGCDCFGCCNLPVGSDRFVFVGSVDEDDEPSCNASGLDDPTRCRPCTPVLDCFNECDTCELCVGRTRLPSSCTEGEDGGAPVQRCAPGVQACGLPGEPGCPATYYCVTGCCVYFG
ncbi:Erythrocyte membrane protein 1 [Sandaracinus amylolyticus]|nr:Erythrocyte membrane protein 1 [Sandaracinus amylolyticus]